MVGLQSYVLAVTGICAGISVILSAALIQHHMAHFSQPLVQSKIVGVLWMVPIYSFDSWLSLSFKDYALFLDMFRDCYEAYVLYLFLALLVAYLGEGDEQKVVELLERQPRIKHIYPFKICHRGEVPHGAEFLKFCKFGTMQYIVLKPTFTLLAIVLASCGLYGEGTFALDRGWIYQTLIMNVSVGYAFYCLGLFYIMLHDALGPHQPVPKFLCIKAVLFLSFWQGVIIAGLSRLGWLPHLTHWTSQNVALAMQDVLICFEMMLVAFAHRYAFPYEPFIGAPALRTNLLEDHFAHYTAVRDFNEVMPVLLPGHFKPGIAEITERAPDGQFASGGMEGSGFKRIGVCYWTGDGIEMGGEGGEGTGAVVLLDKMVGARKEQAKTQGASVAGGNEEDEQKGEARDDVLNGRTRGSEPEGRGTGTRHVPVPSAVDGREALTLDKLPWRI